METVSNLQNKRFINKDLKSHILYGEKPLLKAILIVAIPGLLMSLMTGIYLFTDQLMLAHFVPVDGAHGWANIFAPKFPNNPIFHEWASASVAINEFCSGNNINFVAMNTSDIVKSAINISSPIIMIINAIPIIAAIGAGVMYTQAISLNNRVKADEIWKSSFYFAIFIGLISSIIFFGINDSLLNLLSGSSISLSGAHAVVTSKGEVTVAMMNIYFQTCRSMQILWAHQFLNILSWSSIINVFILYYSFMIRAEGRVFFVAVAGIICDLLNVLFDYIYISIAHKGMQGGGLATLTGWSCNFIVYTVFIMILSYRNKTWMKFKNLLPWYGEQFNLSILGPVFVIGLSVFLRNFVNSIVNCIFLPLMVLIANHSGANGQMYQSIGGATWPITSLFFYAIFGISDGVRQLVAYNYQRRDFQRIRRAYLFTVIISVIYGVIIYILLVAIGKPLLQLFDVQPGMMSMAYRYLILNAIFIPMISFSVGGLMIFQATNQMLMGCFVAVLQGLITWPIATLISGVIAISFHDPMLFIITSGLNTGLAAVAITTISGVYLRRYLGHTRLKVSACGKKIKLVLPSNITRVSYAQRQLTKHAHSSIKDLGFHDGHVVIHLRNQT